MQKFIVLILIVFLSLSTAGAATVEIPEGNTDFILNIDYTRYPGSGDHGRYSAEDTIVIPESVSIMLLYDDLEPEAFLSSWQLDRLKEHPSFKVADDNPRYASDEFGILYEKLQDGTLKVLSIPSAFNQSGDNISYGIYEIPEEITAIGPLAATGCNINSSLAIPPSLTDIDPTAFIMSGVCDFYVHPDNPRYASIEGALYDKTERKLIYATSSMNLTTMEPLPFTIPEGVKAIGNYAFLDSGVEEIILPSTIEDFSPLAFLGELLEGSYSIAPAMISDVSLNGDSESVKIVHETQPLSTGDIWDVTYIITEGKLVAALQSVFTDYESYNNMNAYFGKELFSIDLYHREFEKLTVPEEITEICPYAFFGIQTEILEIPGTVRTIEGSAFCGAEIDELILHEGTERITACDEDTPYLSEVWVPSSLTEIFGFTEEKTDGLLAASEDGMDEMNLIYRGPVMMSVADTFHISRESPFYDYFFAVNPYAIEDVSWLQN